MMGNRTMEYLDDDEADSQQLLDELTSATNNLVQHTGYLPRQGSLRVGSGKQTRYRSTRRMEAIEEANT